MGVVASPLDPCLIHTLRHAIKGGGGSYRHDDCGGHRKPRRISKWGGG